MASSNSQIVGGALKELSCAKIIKGAQSINTERASADIFGTERPILSCRTCRIVVQLLFNKLKGCARQHYIVSFSK